MRIRALFLVCCFAASPGRLLAQGCKQDLQKIVIAQNSYVQIDPAPFRGNNKLFAYLPGIKTPILGTGWSTFQLSIVEGIYGPPFPRARGSISESAFQGLRTSRNVRMTPVSVRYDPQARRAARVSQPVVLADQSVRVEVDDVRTGWVGADTVTFRICR
jgi:hypothetical protein